ncbi:MAG: hypothetical protein HQM08_08940 [Candidatus Riflebacteria bacterium]|nr:hypothetical protein [Candidatus Riflebacteria bacterium]
MTWLDSLERRFPGFAIPGLARMIGMMMFLAFALQQMGVVPVDKWYLSGRDVLSGEAWRLISFIFVPPSFNMLFLLFALMIFVMVGDGLEQEWGSFKLTVYYFVGMLGTIAVAFIVPDVFLSNYFLNLSLFFAFATVYPDYEILVFFVIPVKVKYLGIFSALYIAYMIVFGAFVVKIAAILSVVNYLIFFGPSAFTSVKRGRANYERRKKFEQSFRNDADPRHICVECGRSDKSDPDLVFRYCICPDCGKDGKAFCSDHLGSHLESIKKVTH